MTNKTTPNPHAELIKAWADGAEIQYWDDDNNRWKDCKGYSGFPTWDVELQYRIKPEEDEQWKPKEGETYYFLVSTGAVVKEHFQPSWPGDNARLEIGNCFRTRKEAVSAIPHVKAALKGKNVNVSANVSGNVDSNAGSPEIDGKPLTHIEKECIRKFRAGVPFPEAESGTWRALSPEKMLLFGQCAKRSTNTSLSSQNATTTCPVIVAALHPLTI